MNVPLRLKSFIVTFIWMSLGINSISCISYCPYTFPYAYNGGQHCCAYNLEKPAYTYRSVQDANCDGSVLSSASECCFQDEFSVCSEIPCSTALFESAPCPEKYPNPYYNGLYCCKYATEKPAFIHRTIQTFTCNGDGLTLQSFCCLNDAFVACLNPPCTPATWWSLTWEAEGTDDPADTEYSRKLRVRTGNALIIGRGYSISSFESYYIKQDLMDAGVATATANTISLGSRLTGSQATEFIVNNNLTTFTLTYKQQWELFKIQRDADLLTLKSLFARNDIVALYGAVDFDTRNYYIKGLAFDVMFRGDYTDQTRTFLQSKFVNNDTAGLKVVVGNISLWPNVPVSRFNARKVYLDQVA